MTIWPEDYGSAYTLAAPIELEGVGLHSGSPARVRLEPAEQPGFRIGWLDGSDRSLRLLDPAQVADTQLCTALQIDQRRLATVEHLLAALAGVGLSQVTILVEGHEIPLLDGSALPWVEAIAAAGLQRLGPRPALQVLDGPITLQQGLSFATALPSDRPRLGAATFGFRDLIEQLRAAGLIQGGALDNALVCDGDHWLNPPLRFSDEPVRHKLLDLLGDLALVGLPQAQVFAYRGSHGLHTALAAALARRRPSSPSS